jgi:hypothetical protein
VEFVNETPLSAAILPSSSGEGEMLVLALSCAAYRCMPAGLELEPRAEPLCMEPEAPYVNDAAFLKDCLSVSATGFVYARGGEARRASAALEVGGERREIAAFGPRVWGGAAGGALVATEPLPFDRVPMTWGEAYGGNFHAPTMVIERDGESLIVPERQEGYAPNLQGRGFYMTAEQALDQALPRLEHPDQLVRAWDDRPEPVSFAPYPMFGGLRATALVPNKKLDYARIASVLSKSSPRTTFPMLPAGTPCKLDGMRPRGEALSFVIPGAPVEFEVAIDGKRARLVPRADSIEIDAEKGSVRVVFRVGFRYPLVAEQRRRIRAVPAAALRPSA